MILNIGDKNPKHGIYRCSACGYLNAILSGEIAKFCIDCSEKNRDQHWILTNKEMLVVTKDVRKEVEKHSTRIDRISDKVTEFCGSINFVYIHILWFSAWLIYNLTAPHPFDSYPFGMLTLIVSLEAIILSTFVLISQNREGRITELRSQLDYQTDLKAEKNVAEVLALLHKIYDEMAEGKK